MNKHRPLVSVIIPTYKHSAYVLDTIESVLSQTFDDTEIIVINDGSPDDTADVLQPLRSAGRIMYIETVNRGQAAARNLGIRKSSGRYIAMLDDDDQWPSDKLEWQVDCMETRPEVALVFGHYIALGDSSGKPCRTVETRAYEWADFVGPNPIQSPGQALIRASVLDELGGLDESLWGVDDWDLYLRIVRKYPVQGVARLALLYRWHEGNASRDARRMRSNELTVLNRHFALPGRRGTFIEWAMIRLNLAYHYRHQLRLRGSWLLAYYEGLLVRVLYYALRLFGVGRRKMIEGRTES